MVNNDKYSKYLDHKGKKRGGVAGFGVEGPKTNRRISVKLGSGITDPKSAVTEISHGVRIKGQICMGHYDINGLPVKGPMKINNMRIDDGEGKLVSRLQFVALTQNISNDGWFDENKALLYNEYIEKQYDSRLQRGKGYVYSESFFEKIKPSRKKK